MTSQSMNISDFKELVKMKRENPNEYKSFLKQMVDVSMDMVEIAGEVVKERQDKIKKMQEDLSKAAEQKRG